MSNANDPIHNIANGLRAIRIERESDGLRLALENRRLNQDKYDLIRALEWLHDNTLKHIQSEDRRQNITGVEHALDRAWELLEEMKQTK